MLSPRITDVEDTKQEAEELQSPASVLAVLVHGEPVPIALGVLTEAVGGVESSRVWLKAKMKMQRTRDAVRRISRHIEMP